MEKVNNMEDRESDIKVVSPLSTAEFPTFLIGLLLLHNILIVGNNSKYISLNVYTGVTIFPVSQTGAFPEMFVGWC